MLPVDVMIAMQLLLSLLMSPVEQDVAPVVVAAEAASLASASFKSLLRMASRQALQLTTSRSLPVLRVLRSAVTVYSGEWMRVKS